MSLAIRAWTSLFLLIEIFEAVQLKVVDCRSVWKSYSNTVFWAFFLAVATHQTSILIDHHHLRLVLIETKAGDGTGIDTSPALRAGRLIQFDAQHLLLYLKAELTQPKVWVFRVVHISHKGTVTSPRISLEVDIFQPVLIIPEWIVGSIMGTATLPAL